MYVLIFKKQSTFQSEAVCCATKTFNFSLTVVGICCRSLAADVSELYKLLTAISSVAMNKVLNKVSLQVITI
jgi:hypothetical protein